MCLSVCVWCVGCVHLIDDLQQQLAAYISWVNSQLKRKPGLQPIGDLRHDLQDGVVLVQLIEIVGKYTYGQFTRLAHAEETLFGEVSMNSSVNLILVFLVEGDFIFSKFEMSKQKL